MTIPELMRDSSRALSHDHDVELELLDMRIFEADQYAVDALFGS
jgi:hypothetical protein